MPEDEIDVFGPVVEMVYERDVPEEDQAPPSLIRVYLLAADDPARTADPCRMAEVQWTGRPDGWMVAAMVHRMPDGTMAIRELTIVPDSDMTTTEASIGRTVLRRLRGSTLTDQLGLAIAEAPGTRMYTAGGVTDPPPSCDAARMAADATKAKPATGRPPLSDEEIAETVQAFLEDPGYGYAARVGARLGLPETTVKNRLSRARYDGWLAATSPGRRGEAREGPRYTEWRRRRRPVGSAADVVVVDTMPRPRSRP